MKEYIMNHERVINPTLYACILSFTPYYMSIVIWLDMTLGDLTRVTLSALVSEFIRNIETPKPNTCTVTILNFEWNTYLANFKQSVGKITKIRSWLDCSKEHSVHGLYSLLRPGIRTDTINTVPDKIDDDDPWLMAFNGHVQTTN